MGRSLASRMHSKPQGPLLSWHTGPPSVPGPIPPNAPRPRGGHHESHGEPIRGPMMSDAVGIPVPCMLTPQGVLFMRCGRAPHRHRHDLHTMNSLWVSSGLLIARGQSA